MLNWVKSGKYTWLGIAEDYRYPIGRRGAAFIEQLSPTRYQGCSYINHEWVYASTVEELQTAIETTHDLLGGLPLLY